jgi:hypothetical protein
MAVGLLFHVFLSLPGTVSAVVRRHCWGKGAKQEKAAEQGGNQTGLAKHIFSSFRCSKPQVGNCYLGLEVGTLFGCLFQVSNSKA